MRGEHPGTCRGPIRRRGSSPHARGAPAQRRGRVRALGIIPACAGSTPRIMTPLPRSRDHPRMRGEHQPYLGIELEMEGSSPHARGARASSRCHNRRIGIIPACAGSTCPSLLPCRLRTDHPRMRGEHPRGRYTIPCRLGSSPHARGAPAE